ncbi:hypothetical protein ACTWP6_27345 [Mycobacterium sp. 4D054]|uniref:hypothetical protein n=1 Tax=Mycobacterium sp. 4D054 TaxID=3457440 RepID=UPI003FD00486
MAVKVTLSNGSSESFDGAGDEFFERKDGKLAIHREDGTVKVFTADTWTSVDGKRKLPAKPRAGGVW